VDLALDDHRIDDGADVIDAPETDDIDAAGVRIVYGLLHATR